MDVDPVVYLLALADSTNRSEAPSPSVAAWLANGVRAYLNGAGLLDSCLGLSGRHWRAITRHQYAERNRYLQEAFRIAGNDATRLADAISEFRVIWPRWRGLDAPPARATLTQSVLWRAFETGVDVPGSLKQLKRICGR